MSNEALQELYQYVVLPQFGLSKDVKIVWEDHKIIGPDDDAHYFKLGDKQYVLIFTDYGRFEDADIKELIKLPHGKFEYITPTSQSDCSPAYRFSLPVPFKYAHNVTGYFTLIKTQ